MNLIICQVVDGEITIPPYIVEEAKAIYGDKAREVFSLNALLEGEPVRRGIAILQDEGPFQAMTFNGSHSLIQFFMPEGEDHLLKLEVFSWFCQPGSDLIAWWGENKGKLCQIS